MSQKEPKPDCPRCGKEGGCNVFWSDVCDHEQLYTWNEMGDTIEISTSWDDDNPDKGHHFIRIPKAMFELMKKYSEGRYIVDPDGQDYIRHEVGDRYEQES